ncbi:hypothetical protein GC194_07955 [bacterium]|nr:hypothetical protein [bacterium]
MPVLSKSLKTGVLVLITAVLATLNACNEPTDKPTPKFGKLTVNVINHVDGEDVVLETGTYVNEAQNTYHITRLQYYLSNFQFLSEGCNDFVPENDYHLISHIVDPNLGDPIYKNTSFTYDIPVGCYNSVNFGIGVDPTRNEKGPYTGDLDFTWNMNWSWAGDYIFFKHEGKYIGKDDKEKDYIFHVGSSDFYKTAELKLSKTLNVEENGEYTLNIYANVNEYFSKPYKIDLNYTNTTMSPDALADSLATNYSDMFSLDKP